MSNEPDEPARVVVVKCAACHRRLGTCTRDGWLWVDGPARLVNRRKLITTTEVSVDLGKFQEPQKRAVEDDPDSTYYCYRTASRAPKSRMFTVYERPSTCDSDTCMDALGPEYVRIEGVAPFALMPEGRLLS